MYTLPHSYINTNACMQTHTRTHTHARTHARARARTHTHIHSLNPIHTHIQTHARSYKRNQFHILCLQLDALFCNNSFFFLLGSPQITYLEAQVVNIGDNATVNVTGELLDNYFSTLPPPLSNLSKLVIQPSFRVVV